MSSLQVLMTRVQGGDVAAAGELRRLLQPVVSRTVRRVLDGGDDPSPLGRQVRGLLAEVGAPAGTAPADLEWTASAITRTLCQRAVARVRHAPAVSPTAETVLA